MADKRRVLRRVETDVSNTFDEQVWPINVALLVLSGFVAGAIIALGRFDDPYWLTNAWIHLAILAVVVGASMGLATRLDSRWMRRSVQLAALASMIVHTGLTMVLYSQRLAEMSTAPPRQVASVDPQLMTVPDYHIQAPEAQLEEHEKPVEVATPERADNALEREPSDSLETPVKSQPTPVPGSIPEVQPSPLELRRAEEALPRRAHQPSELSRQLTEAELQMQASAPEVQSRSQEPRPDLQAKRTSIDRRSTSIQPQKQAVENQSTIADPRARALQRRQSEPDAANQVASARPLPRAISAPPVEPTRAEAPALRAAKTVERAQTQAAVQVARRQTAPARFVAPLTGPRVDGPPSVEPGLVTRSQTGGAARRVNAQPSLNISPEQTARARLAQDTLATVAGQQVADVPSAPDTASSPAAAASSVVQPTAAIARTTTDSEAPAAIAAPDAGALAGPGSAPEAATLARAERVGDVLAGPSATSQSPQLKRTLGGGSTLLAEAEAPQLPSGGFTSGAGTGAAPAPSIAVVRSDTAALGGPQLTGSLQPGEAGGDASAQFGRSASAPSRSLQTGDPGGPAVAVGPSTGAAVGRSFARGTAQVGEIAALPQATASASDDDAAASDADNGTASLKPSAIDVRRTGTGEGAPNGQGGASRVDIAAAEGPGGLASGVSPQVGSLSRRSSDESKLVHSATGRFLSRSVGGPLAVDGRAREPAEAFAHRAEQRLNKRGGRDQAGERTEKAVELGLAFLARHQSSDGSWSLNNFGKGQAAYENERANFNSDTAATGLALLSFLGAGYDHYDDEYREVVRSALAWLISHQKPTGDLYVAQDAVSDRNAWFYSHGIAAIALCEAYGMTGDKNLRAPAQGAIDFIVAAQNPALGGWRYGMQIDSDTSVSGWQLMALKSGELAGLNIPRATYERAHRWLEGAEVSNREGTQYVYNPLAPDTAAQRRGRRPNATMTAVGLLMRLYLGSNRDDPRMVRGADYLYNHLPSLDKRDLPGRDTYYWYYATQVMFHMRGRHWKAWNNRLHPLLVDHQVQDGVMSGSWDPLGPVRDRWGEAGGRIYVTTMNLLSLEVYYRHLPIYESTAR